MKLTISYFGSEAGPVEVECDGEDASGVVANRAAELLGLPAAVWLLRVEAGPNEGLAVNADEWVDRYFDHGDRAGLLTIGQGV